MTGETLEKESAAVQIGHPITERRFTTAIPILRDQRMHPHYYRPRRGRNFLRRG